MAPTTTIAASQLRQLIYYHLDNDMLDNASFLAQRLHALEPRNADAQHLLALTYLRARRPKAAYDFSHKSGASGRHLGCAYVFAQACFDLERYSEGSAALEACRKLWMGKNDWNKHSETSRRHLPDAPAVLTLLGRLYRAHGELRKAGDCFIEAHKQNAFVWDAFEGLCKIGADLKVENMFRQTTDMPAPSELGSRDTQVYVDEDSRLPLGPQPNFGSRNATASMDDPFTSSRPESALPDPDPLPKVKGKSALSEWDTPTIQSSILDDDVTMAENQDDVFAPAAPSRRVRPGQQLEASDRPRFGGQSEGPEDTLQAPRKPGAQGQKRTISGAASQASADSSQPRRSNRLFTQSITTRMTRSTADTTASVAGRADRTVRTAKAATGTKGRTGAVVGRVVSGNRKVMPPDEKEKEKDKRAISRSNERSFATSAAPVMSSIALPQQKPQATSQHDALAEQQAMNSLLDNFRQLAVGSHAIAKFELPDAIQAFRSLPSAQRETPWVLAQLGKAYYEAADYKTAEECFSKLMRMQPSRIEDMEIYSTVLWHLKKESTLSFLCRVLRDNHFDAPETWVAVGNAFSLTREHDSAISAFKRATQLDEKFAYAYTLMGHEYMANEAFDAGLLAFRKAVAIERRGYGGWYGLGKCYERMGKLEDAERHYQIAHKINPSNSTLLVCIGVVMERLRNKDAALKNYAQALELAPQSALARFKKARVLMHMKEYDDALEELHILRDQAPDEANVWFLLGKCYKGLTDKAAALRAFTTALNLDVKAAPFIKEAMEALDEEDEDSDDD
ncbi:hypothetical protein PRZ48_005950 [Zasmidium cellare]|uniref:TPR-like protein n=1 Tax=Zasmidium cellare TaxID=395010 RepID=A0ABR0EMP3_ZASCE|nr:hypothetical protein PRZ48_005950 [Zasmidium cellare]